MSRTSSLVRRLKRVVFTGIFFTCLVAQPSSSSTGSFGKDAFFLDLGIVIEPRTGNEEVNRYVKAPPEKIKFFVDKAPSGSVFIATTKELEETLQRIGKRLGNLEYAFQKEVTTLKEENQELRGKIANLLEKETERTDETVVEKSKPATIPESGDQEEERSFNRVLYMNAVLAYQREDYTAALNHFLKLFLGTIDVVTAGNVLYWISDSYYQRGDYGDALNILQTIKPLFGSDKQDDAVVLTGLVYRQMGNETEAIEAFMNIVEEHPDSEYFKLAQMEIRKAER